MKRGNTNCRSLQKRRDWIRKRLKFTVKIIFLDAAIGSKNYALQEYLSKDSGQLVSLAAVFGIVTQRSCLGGGALRDDTKNGCEGDYGTADRPLHHEQQWVLQ